MSSFDQEYDRFREAFRRVVGRYPVNDSILRMILNLALQATSWTIERRKSFLVSQLVEEEDITKRQAEKIVDLYLKPVITSEYIFIRKEDFDSILKDIREANRKLNEFLKALKALVKEEGKEGG